MNAPPTRHPASYRDPAGFVFEKDGILHRSIHPLYRSAYQTLMQSGLYDRLVQQNLLIPHEVVERPNSADTFLVIKPQRIHPIMAPWHWTYDMLKQAALLTLKIQQISLEYGMSLKDAHPSNIQFIGSAPILIDTLSLGHWETEKPWVAYRQYCESFLLPLVTGNYLGAESPQLLRAWPNGLPLNTGRKLLPLRSKLYLHWLLHIHLNARQFITRKSSDWHQPTFSAPKMKNLLRSLQLATEKCRAAPNHSEWINYENDVQDRGEYSRHKLNLIKQETDQLPQVNSIVDLGSNTGVYSQTLQRDERKIIQLESDSQTLNRLYLRNLQAQHKNCTTFCLNIEELLPAGQDPNRIPSIRSDLVLCLGLLHHLTYRNNIPLTDVLNLLHQLSNRHLWIEFIDPADPLIVEFFNPDIVAKRPVDQLTFEAELQKLFTIRFQSNLTDSTRRLYLCSKK